MTAGMFEPAVTGEGSSIGKAPNLDTRVDVAGAFIVLMPLAQPVRLASTNTRAARAAKRTVRDANVELMVVAFRVSGGPPRPSETPIASPMPCVPVRDHYLFPCARTCRRSSRT